MSAMTSSIVGVPIRRFAELPAMPTTFESCCMLSSLSPTSGPISGQAANKMRDRVRAIHALVVCSFGWQRDRGFDNLLEPAARPEPSAPVADNFGTSAIPPVFSLLSLDHSLGAVPAPHHPSTHKSCAGDPDSAALRCSASSPSGLGFQQQISRAKNTLEISCRSLRRKHISALGAGHLTSLRARVSRRQSGQIQTGEKQWHSTETTSR